MLGFVSVAELQQDKTKAGDRISGWFVGIKVRLFTHFFFPLPPNQLKVCPDKSQMVIFAGHCPFTSRYFEQR